MRFNVFSNLKLIRLTLAVSILMTAGCGPTITPKTETANTNRPIRVFIVAGQSNAVGYNNISEYQNGNAAFPDKYLHQPDILYWNTSTKDRPTAWKTLRVNDNGSFGPEITFAYDLAAANPNDRIAIIKCAVGGTGIARSADYTDYISALKNFNDKGNNWHPLSDNHPAGQLYQMLIEDTHAALAQLESEHFQWKLTGFIWMQGEHEAGISLKMATDYEKLLTEFIGAIRGDLNTPCLPVAIGQVNSHTWAYGDIVRQAQENFCKNDTNAALVKTTDLSRNGSGGPAHFDADATLTLGSRFSAAMKQFICSGDKP